MLWSMVSKVADRSKRQRHDNFCDPMALMIMDIQQSCFSGVMLAVGRLVGIEKTIDHNILITCLSSWFGIHGSVLNWFES